MKPQRKTLPVFSTPSRSRLVGIVASCVFCFGAASARAQFRQWSGDAPQAPVYYLYDYVNRASSLTPEPIWRSMFPGVLGRMQAERREFGTVGESAGEVLYFRSFRRHVRKVAY